MDLTEEDIELTQCSDVNTMGFVCEHPARSDSCFTKMSVPLQSMGYESAESATSSDCASSCLSEDDCAGIYISLETSCTTLIYDTDMPSILPGSIFNSTYIYHRKYIYHSHYYGFIPGLSEEELCSLPIGSPIITTTIAGETTTETINPTTTEKTTEDGAQTSDSTSETTTEDGAQTSDSTSESTTEDGAQTSDSTSETTTENGAQTSDSTSESTTIDGEQTSDSTSESTTEDGAQTTDLTSETTTNALQSNTSMSNGYVYNFSSCVCVCTETNLTLEEKIENIVSKLRLETSTLSSAVRKKTCAEDLRPSAKNVGLIGIVILCIIAAILLCFDALRCTKAIFEKNNPKGTNMYKKGKRVNR
ncbi:papilin-like [Saccostrea cucullata]|uniref:papilin-like n=1 Tax=Saccostrea cuccullata TaxID=36930 RepID=UPI002ED13DF9